MTLLTVAALLDHNDEALAHRLGRRNPSWARHQTRAADTT
jgi:hypothetical protein